MKIHLVASLLVLSTAMAACATPQSVYHTNDAEDKPGKTKVAYVTLTGSRILQRVDLNNPNKDSIHPITILTREQFRAAMMRR